MTFTKTMEALKYAHEKASIMTAALNESFTRQQTPAVAPAEVQATTSNLISQISFKLIADSSLASVRTCIDRKRDVLIFRSIIHQAADPRGCTRGGPGDNK